nr:hypothetical protein [Tanacetum cinerariifolium]
MPKYAKFLKGLLSNKTRLEEACRVTMNERCSAVLLNKLPSKEKDPGSFTIPCNIGHLHINNALIYLGDSISLMPYTMHEKLGLWEPKPMRMSLELADRYVRRLYNSKNHRETILTTAQAIIDVFNKKIILRVGSEEVIFDVDQSIKKPPAEDDECYGIDNSDTTIHWKTHELLEDDQMDSFIVNNLEGHIDQSDFKSCESQETQGPVKMQNEHLYSTSANEIDEKWPELKDLPSHLEYAYMKGNESSSFFQIPIAPEDQEKTTFTCSYGTFSYRRMPFGLCNALATFQRCMATIHDMVEDFMKVFMDDFLVFGFNIEIKDKKGKSLAADHLSRLEIPNIGELTEEEIADEFLDEHLMILKSKLNDDEPWYADYVNYIVRKVVPLKWTPKRRKRFFSQVRNYFRDEPYAFRLCLENVMSRCVARDEILKILEHCHSGQTGEHHSASVTWRKTNGHTEVTNRAIKCILERTTYKTPTRCTSFKMVYGKTCHLPIEIEHKAYWALKQCNMDLTGAAKNHFMEQNELMELRDGAYENTRFYKERTKKWHDSRLRRDKNFKNKDKVLLFNSRLKLHPEKLKSKWSCPFVEITDKNGSSFKVNGQRLKIYYYRSFNTEDNEFVELEE